MKITCSKCGEFLDLTRIYKYRYCKKCHSEYERKYRLKHSQLSEEQKKKANCRTYSNVYLSRGKLIPKPCEKCGEAKAEKHHEDYDKPLQVTWLCRPCHLDLHSKIKAKELEESARYSDIK